MTKGVKWFWTISIFILVVSGCEDSNEPDPNINAEINSEYVSNDDEIAFEQRKPDIDMNDSLKTANFDFGV